MLTEVHDGFNFCFGEGAWLVGYAHKAGDACCGADGKPGIIGDDHFDEHVAGEGFFFDGRFFTFLNLYFFLGGDKNFKDFVSKSH